MALLCIDVRTVSFALHLCLLFFYGGFENSERVSFMLLAKLLTPSQHLVLNRGIYLARIVVFGLGDCW